MSSKWACMGVLLCRKSKHCCCCCCPPRKKKRDNMLDALGDARAWLLFCIIKKKGWDQCSCMLYAAWLANRCYPKDTAAPAPAANVFEYPLSPFSVQYSVHFFFSYVYIFFSFSAFYPSTHSLSSFIWLAKIPSSTSSLAYLSPWVSSPVCRYDWTVLGCWHTQRFFLFFKAASFLDALGLNLLKLDHVKEAQKPASQRRRDCYRPLWHLGLSTYIASQVIGSTIALS